MERTVACVVCHRTRLHRRALHRVDVREERTRRDIDEIFDDCREWIQKTIPTERTPWLEVIC